MRLIGLALRLSHHPDHEAFATVEAASMYRALLAKEAARKTFGVLL